MYQSVKLITRPVRKMSSHVLTICFAFFQIPRGRFVVHAHKTLKYSSPHVRVYRYIDARDKTRERDHSLWLKLPGLSSPSPRTGYIAGTLFRRTFVRGVIAPGSSLTIDRARQDFLLRPAFFLPSSGLSSRAQSFLRCVYILACAHIHIYTLTCTQMYSGDRIKRIRVWRIEFNMVIMSDENVRASSLLEGTRGKSRGIQFALVTLLVGNNKFSKLAFNSLYNVI